MVDLEYCWPGLEVGSSAAASWASGEGESGREAEALEVLEVDGEVVEEDDVGAGETRGSCWEGWGAGCGKEMGGGRSFAGLRNPQVADTSGERLAGSLGSLKTEAVLDRIDGVRLELGLNTQACRHPPHRHLPRPAHHRHPQWRQKGRTGGWLASPHCLRCSDSQANCSDISGFQELVGSRLWAPVTPWDS